MIPTILCVVTPSVEFLGSTTPAVLKPDWRLCDDGIRLLVRLWMKIASQRPDSGVTNVKPLTHICLAPLPERERDRQTDRQAVKGSGSGGDIRGQRFMTSTRRGMGVRLRWTVAWTQGVASSPCGRPQKLESTDVILSSSRANQLARILSSFGIKSGDCRLT